MPVNHEQRGNCRSRWMKDTFHRIVTRQTPNGCGQQMLLCGVASNFWGLFAGFPAEAFFFQLFHNAAALG